MDPMRTTTLHTDRPREDIQVMFDYEISNTPGKSIVSLKLNYPPNGFTPPHRHGGATVVAYITEGEVLSGMNDNPPKVYKQGQSFIEHPGCHHTVGENNSEKNGAKAIAVFVVDTEVIRSGGYEALTKLDDEWA